VQEKSKSSESKQSQSAVRRTRPQSLLIVIAAGLVATAGVTALVVLPTWSPNKASSEPIVLANGVLAPSSPENKWHGWSPTEHEPTKIETCDEWDLWWLYEGPAVSSAAAQATGFSGISVSTEHYVHNQHLDLDKDGVLCFFENLPKPSVEAGSQQWLKAFDAVWSSLETGRANELNLDFAASPNTNIENAEIIRAGVESALGAWTTHLTTDKPISLTVVHPDDKEWFTARWESLGKGGVAEGWFDDVSIGGGGAAGANPDGSISLYFMISEFTPPTGTFDFYYHEVTHVFESQFRGAFNEPVACWTAEGPATFFGFSKVAPLDREASSSILAALRVDRAAVLARYFEANNGLNEESLRKTVLEVVNSDSTCQFEAPYFGYYIGMFVAEKVLIDFGMEGFVSLSQQGLQGSDEDLSRIFMKALGVDYKQWVNDSLAPYLVEEIRAITKGVS
jgi:hypothetical protein